MNNTLEPVIYHLLNTEPFFAHFLTGCNVVYDPKGCDTAGVALTRRGIEFVINREWFFKHPLLQQVAILKHEVFHVLLDHCGARGLDGTHKGNQQAKNIAMDCAINQFIPHLPDLCVTLEALSKTLKMDLAPLEAWEYYYERIKDQVSNDPDQKHNHDYMDEHSEDIGQALKEAMVKDAASKAVSASAGNVPREIGELIQKLGAPAQFSWKQKLRNFVSSARSVRNKPTQMKTHRRFGLDQPGKKKIRELVIGVCADSSGSVSDESYAAFLNEIRYLAKATKMTYLVHADSTVQRIDKIKDGKAKGDTLSERHGGGGTAYQPAIDACMKLKVDAIIYFGDMDAADTPKDPGVPFIWVRVGNQSPPGNFGAILDLK